ncbi:MAG: insulinase family protein [Chloroflexaceae bacterium]|nr:insulinase family protein [Chloroflexaceae bacterium]
MAYPALPPLFGTNSPGPVGGLSSTTRQTLSNGMVVLVLNNPSSPTVSLCGAVGVGAIHETADRSGLADFTASALIRGTRSRTYQQMITETEARGCSIGADAGNHLSGFYGKALSEDLPLMLEILADMLVHPTFPEPEMEKLRNQMLIDLREYEEDTGMRTTRALRSLLYPPDHPYSRLSFGTIETIQNISRDDMIAFHQHYHPAATSIAIVGDVQPEAVVETLERIFGDWNPPETSLTRTLPDVPPLSGVQRCNMTIPGKVQSDMVMGVHGITRTDPDYYAFLLGNLILGQLGLFGRLGESVREKQGLAYHVSSSLQAGLGAGPWVATAGVNPASVEQAIQAILHEIERFKREGPTSEELSDARAYLTGSMVLVLESNAGLVSTLLDLEIYGLGLDFIERFPDIINRVSREEIIAVARTYLSTEDYVVAVAGPPSSSATCAA